MKPQKVLHFHIEEAKKKPKLDGKFLISEKLDGWYTYVDFFTETGKWDKVRSRAMRIIPAFEHIDFKNLISTPKFNCRLIMEATIPSLNFHTINGIFNRTKGNYTCDDVIFNVHDVVNRDKLGIFALDRYKTYLLGIPHFKNRIKVHTILGLSSHKEDWINYFHTIMERGGEGIILRKTTAGYSPDKRNSDLMKIKLEETYDLTCIKMYTTIGEKGNENLNLLLRDSDSIEVPVRIGKYDDIDLFNKISPVGKIIEIKAMCKLPDGSYREPRFKAIRWDK